MIDTENKRRSVQALSTGLMRPVPDGALDEGDRATCAWYYAGLSYGPPVPPSPGGGISDGTGISPSVGISIPPGLSPTSGISQFIAWLFGGRRDHASS